ncbi:MAG TPA: type II toxin-antitoxin system VapC family toxin [Rhizomicrobium sp.]
MNFLLDTNAVSEWVKPRPDPGLMDWLATIDEDRVFLSVITLAELRRGIDRMPGGRRRHRLDEWLQNDLPLRFEARLLPIDDRIAEEWGRTVARREASGRPISAMDAFVAATAAIHALTLVTRNVEDFRSSVEVLDPWTS